MNLVSMSSLIPNHAPHAAQPSPQFCVLASSSGGNCSAVSLGTGPSRRVLLIDAGLSPRRTMAMLAAVGLANVPIAGMLLTHLDADHCHPGWVAAWPRIGGNPADAGGGCSLMIHRQHRSRAERAGMLHHRTHIFDGCFSLGEALGTKSGGACGETLSVKIDPMLASHDDLGVAVFRFAFANGCTMGFATDLGRPTRTIAKHLADVDVLAIESNYCPTMQVESDRPEYLKRRIMGGAGHLSNQQSAAMVREARPRRDLVLLHLSRQCNEHVRAATAHAGTAARVTIAHHDRPTPWIPLVPQGVASAELKPSSMEPESLWEMV
jgi:phosphoribosyl 1,2-cyclic phosphodiesterase